MNLNPDPAESARLEALAYQAQDYALHMMRTTGSAPSGRPRQGLPKKEPATSKAADS
jgi:hypothetical protein